MSAWPLLIVVVVVQENGRLRTSQKVVKNVWRGCRATVGRGKRRALRRLFHLTIGWIKGRAVALSVIVPNLVDIVGVGDLLATTGGMIINRQPLLRARAIFLALGGRYLP